MTNTNDPLLGFSPDEIVVGPSGETLAQAAAVRVRLLGYDLDYDVHDAARDVVSPELATVDAALDWITHEAQVARERLVIRGDEIWVGGACAALGIIEGNTTPPSLAEELASMPDADRRVAERVADLAEIEPPPGYEDRALERAKREGVLPSGA